MADEKKSAAPSFDEKSLKLKLENLVKYQMTFLGKYNMNPALWIRHNINPLLDRLNRGEKTPELAKAISELKEVPPLIDPLAPKEPVKEVEKVIATPAGLKLKQK